MSSENSDAGGISLSLVAQFDDINRLNNVLNDGSSEECKYSYILNCTMCNIFINVKWRYM